MYAPSHEMKNIVENKFDIPKIFQGLLRVKLLVINCSINYYKKIHENFLAQTEGKDHLTERMLEALFQKIQLISQRCLEKEI